MQELQQDNEGNSDGWEYGMGIVEKRPLYLFSFLLLWSRIRKYAARHKNVHLFVLFVNRVLLAVLFVVLRPDVCNACICCQR